jgi:predicted transcriptional regulator of viral defense system
MTKYDGYEKQFREHQGILRMSSAIRLGIPGHVIYEMAREGRLLQETRGVYRLADMEPPGNPDLVQIGLRVPKCVICLISALYHFGLTSQVPHRVYIALPSNIPRPRIDYPPIDVTWVSPDPFSAGIVEDTIDSVKIRFYDPEKTITDCFKFRKKVGEDVALEALKDYMRRPNPNVTLLMEYARINRVSKLIRPYIEALLS